MVHKGRWIAGGTLALAVIGGGTGVVIVGAGDADKPLAGSNLDKATAAALEALSRSASTRASA
jgi:hypothetical protein